MHMTSSYQCQNCNALWENPYPYEYDPLPAEAFQQCELCGAAGCGDCIKDAVCQRCKAEVDAYEGRERGGE
jgi:uncharacterized paraquat-inducible protein A